MVEALCFTSGSSLGSLILTPLHVGTPLHVETPLHVGTPSSKHKVLLFFLNFKEVIAYGAGSPWKLETPPRGGGSPQYLDFVEGTTNRYWENGAMRVLFL